MNQKGNSSQKTKFNIILPNLLILYNVFKNEKDIYDFYCQFRIVHNICGEKN